MPTGRPATSIFSAIAGRIRSRSVRPYLADAEYHSSRSPGGSSATRNGAIAPRWITPAA
jgi:hypothetical protein